MTTVQLVEWFKKLFRTGSERLDKHYSANEKAKIEVLQAKNVRQASIINDKNKEIKELLARPTVPEPDPKEEFWNDKWPKAKITYKAQGNIIRDVRNLVCDKSFVLNKTVLKWKVLTAEEIAYECERYVINNVTYKGDFDVHKKAEFWQHPENTFGMGTGDCEDGALLIASLMLIAGVPSYRLKICAGFVQNPSNSNEVIGHAYCIFLRDDETWCVLDWCYYADNRKVVDRNEHKDLPKYKEIWFTFNSRYTWAQTDVML